MRVLFFAAVVCVACEPAPVADIVDAGPTFGVVASASNEAVRDADRACTAPSDCTIVDATCCSCTNASGALAAVNVAAVASIEERLEVACAGFACLPALSGEESCCAQGTACIDGRCELVGPRGTSIIVECE